MHDNKPNNFYIKHVFIIFQIKKLQRLFDTLVPLGIPLPRLCISANEQENNFRTMFYSISLSTYL
jgi:hypothetical protein